MNSKEGAKASKDSSRDNWRTPRWLMDVLHAEFPMLWDATGRGPDEWAHGCEDGNMAPDALAAEWPTHRQVFCNPPFSQMKEWAHRIAEHPGRTVTVCKLAPSTEWFKVLTIYAGRLDAPHDPMIFPTYGHGTGYSLCMLGGVSLWLLPVRVAYEPPPGIKASRPSFDSCVVVRR